MARRPSGSGSPGYFLLGRDVATDEALELEGDGVNCTCTEGSGGCSPFRGPNPEPVQNANPANPGDDDVLAPFDVSGHIVWAPIPI